MPDDPDTLEHIDTEAPAEPAISSLATVVGDDIYLDPPVRLLPQYDSRWAQQRIAGPKTGRMLNWVENGCNASTAAMILRWFAEDCTVMILLANPFLGLPPVARPGRVRHRNGLFEVERP